MFYNHFYVNELLQEAMYRHFRSELGIIMYEGFNDEDDFNPYQ